MSGTECMAQENGEWCRDDDDGNPCPTCEAERNAEAAYWLGQWKAASPEEKLGREEFEAQLRDAGRSHDRR